MKRLLTIITVLMMLVAVSGCGKEETKVCKFESDFIISTNTITAKGDKVSKLVYDYVINMQAAGYTEEGISDQVQTEADSFNAKGGVNYTFSFEGDSFKYKIVIDVEKASMNDLAELGILPSTENFSGISLAKTLEGMTAEGFSCN